MTVLDDDAEKLLCQPDVPHASFSSLRLHQFQQVAPDPYRHPRLADQQDYDGTGEARH